jgi:hypothetical protein
VPSDTDLYRIWIVCLIYQCYWNQNRPVRVLRAGRSRVRLARQANYFFSFINCLCGSTSLQFGAQAIAGMQLSARHFVLSSEMSVTTRQNTRRHIPEDL